MAKKWKMRFNKGIPCMWDGDEYDEEREVVPFEADLYVYGYSRGRSSAVMIFVNYEDRNKHLTFYNPKTVYYQVFMSDLTWIMKNVNKGRVKGTFSFVKKGSNYGIELIKAE